MAPKVQEPKFEFYECVVGDGKAFIRVDVARYEHGPEAGRPHSLRVLVRLKDPREDGLTRSNEAKRLRAFEDALVKALDPTPLVGVLTAGGARHWYFYSDDPDRDADKARAVHEAMIESNDAEFGSFEDPEWEQYFEFLYPNKLAWQYIKDVHVLAVLEKDGDDGETPRQIDHWAYFPTRTARRAFTKRVRRDGFRLLGKSTNRVESRPFGLHFANAEHLAPVGIFPHTERLTLWAEECRGTYDGWEVPLLGAVPDDPA